MTKRTAVCGLVGGAMIAACAALGACNIVGPVGYFVLGPEKVPAAYELDPEKTTVVFVDDRDSRVPEWIIRRRIAQSAEQTLLNEKCVKEMIAGESAMAVITKERYGNPIGIVDVGRAVGAKVVIYVGVQEFTLSPDGREFTPRASVRVKVMDVESKARLWPVDEPGYFALSVDLTERQGAPPSTPGELARAQGELADRLGVAVARLFFKHDAAPVVKRLEERTKESR